jgi:cytidylate kinase
MTLTQNPPSHPAVNTKIERVTEAIESLTIAVCSAQRIPHVPGSFANVRDAREEVATALREFLQPTLRVVGGRDMDSFIDDPFQFGPPKKQ